MRPFTQTKWNLHGVMPCPAWVAIAKKSRAGRQAEAVVPPRAYLSLVREQEQKRGGAVKE